MTAKKAKGKGEANNEAFIVFGLDENKKPKGARFAFDHFEPASKAALSMDMQIHEARTPILAELAKKLPVGRIFARGKSFVPYIRRDLYDKLYEATGGLAREQAKAEEERLQAEGGPEQSATGISSGPPLPRGWDELVAGQMVLAQASLEDGWFECVIVERVADVLTLRWRDYPKYKPFPKHIAAVALVNPGLIIATE